MDFLFDVVGLSVPLIQEINWLTDLKYNVLDCLKPPYFIPKGSVPLENHAGHNLATHAQLDEPKWIRVPFETSPETIKALIQQVLGPVIHHQFCSTCIIYSVTTDRKLLSFQNTIKKWGYD
jgi:hypothetical protein